MLTDEQADQLERLLDTQTESHQAIVDMDPRHRNPQDVLQAIDEVQALLNTLQDVRQFIRPTDGVQLSSLLPSSKTLLIS